MTLCYLCYLCYDGSRRISSIASLELRQKLFCSSIVVPNHPCLLVIAHDLNLASPLLAILKVSVGMSEAPKTRTKLILSTKKSISRDGLPGALFLFSCTRMDRFRLRGNGTYSSVLQGYLGRPCNTQADPIRCHKISWL